MVSLDQIDINKVRPYLKQYGMLLINSALAALSLFLAFSEFIDARLFQWCMFASAILGVTFGLLGKKLTFRFVKELGSERFLVLAATTIVVFTFFVLDKIFS